MGVKYVKDFIFPSSGGFHGDVQRYAKGGHVTKMPAKAKASAKGVPARAKPNAPAKGAPKMESKPAKGKRQGYNEGGRVPGYEMDRLPTKRPPGRGMDLAPARRFKGDYQGYAEGGPVDEILPGDGRGGLEMAMPMPRDEEGIIVERMLPSVPLGGDEPPVGMLTPLPEEPFRRTSGPPPPPGMKVNPNYGKPGQDYYVFIDDAARQDALSAARAALPSQLSAADRMAGRRAAMSERAGMRQDMMRRPGMRGIQSRMKVPRAATPRMGIPKPVPPIEMLEELPRDIRYYKKGGEVKGKSKIGKVMGEYKAGKLHSGSKKGPVVKSEKQAMAIALSEARKAGAKIPKKAEGGIFNDESMAYESKGPKTRGTARKGRIEGRRERRAREAMERAEKYAPGLSLDMADKKKHGGMPVHRRKPMYGGGKC